MIQHFLHFIEKFVMCKQIFLSLFQCLAWNLFSGDFGAILYILAPHTSKKNVKTCDNFFVILCLDSCIRYILHPRNFILIHY